MLSFWEKNSWISYDIIIIGGGIVGMSVAASLVERKPDLQVLLIERGILPCGASTRNAGFACFGSLTEVLADLQKMPEEEVLQLIEDRFRGLGIMQSRLGAAATDYVHAGGYELITEKEKYALEKMEDINKLLYPIFKQQVYGLASEKINLFGFNSHIVKELVLNPLEGQIDTGLTIKSLQRYITARGVAIITGAQVQALDESEKDVMVKTQSATQEVVFSAKQVIVATNAFAQELLPEVEIIPGRGQVIITDPIPGLAIVGSFHMEEGYYYFRNYKNRILFGGGRNLDFETETTTVFGDNEKILADLEKRLREIILPGKEHQIAMHWSGIMAFGRDKKPVTRWMSPRIYAALRMSGMGVALASKLGESAAAEFLQKI